VIELHTFSPVLLVVATLTFLPFLPLVNIILLMAVVAKMAQFLIGDDLTMAVPAFQLLMPIDKLEFSVPVVVEMNILPFTGRVTALTFGAEFSLVLIVVCMAGEAITFKFFFVDVASVTGGTSHLDMAHFYFEFGIPIVIEYESLPVLLHVASLALFTKLPPVFVIEGMA